MVKLTKETYSDQGFVNRVATFDLDKLAELNIKQRTFVMSHREDCPIDLTGLDSGQRVFVMVCREDCEIDLTGLNSFYRAFVMAAREDCPRDFTGLSISEIAMVKKGFKKKGLKPKIKRPREWRPARSNDMKTIATPANDLHLAVCQECERHLEVLKANIDKGNPHANDQILTLTFNLIQRLSLRFEKEVNASSPLLKEVFDKFLGHVYLWSEWHIFRQSVPDDVPSVWYSATFGKWGVFPFTDRASRPEDVRFCDTRPEAYKYAFQGGGTPETQEDPVLGYYGGEKIDSEMPKETLLKIILLQGKSKEVQR